MIIPFPEDIHRLKRYPLTLTLLILNTMIFFLFFTKDTGSLSSSQLLNSEGLHLTGRLYYQYLQDLPAKDLYVKPTWVQQMSFYNSEQMKVLGSYALRDSDFLAKAEHLKFTGDDIKILSWRKNLSEFCDEYKDQTLFHFGLSSLSRSPLSWLTYQFSHSNWLHLFSNMAYLLVIGVAVELLVGSAWLLAVYILGGLAGGLGFLLSDAHGTVPMVGASASISALLAFYCVAEVRRRVRYMFFVSPAAGLFGAIYLPTLLIVPLFLLADLASFWASPEGLGGGVAYAAHLGGTVCGLAMGLTYRKWARFQSSVKSSHLIDEL